MSRKIDKQVEKALKDQFPVFLEEIKLFGSSSRPNSWTFKVKIESEAMVVKVLKPPRRGEDFQVKAEEEALERIATRKDLKVVQYVSKGSILVSNRKLMYFVFPFIQGNDLGKLINKGSFTEEKAFVVFDTLVETIFKLAEEKVVHQDIKPGNIMIQPNGSALLLDFGIARFLDYGHTLAKQQGPARYLSPEQVTLGLNRLPINQRKLTFLSDIYSAGVVLLHMLLGNDFYSEWPPDFRSQVARQVNEGEIVEINDKDKKKLLSTVLQESVNARADILDQLGKEKREGFLKRKPGLVPFWHLHHWSTGTTILTKFAKENTAVKAGVIYASEHIRSVENNIKSCKEIRNLGWKVGIDPSTYKLTFLKDHLAELKERNYYRESLDPSHFHYPKFLKEFVLDVIDFQKRFSPDIYISPYFFISEPDDPYLDINFSLFEETEELMAGSGSPIMFGLAISEGMFTNKKKLDGLLDQLILYPRANSLYVRTELVKANNRPCSDEQYLGGLMYFTKQLSRFKSVLLSQVDQSILGVFANTRLSAALNPEAFIRKQDIKDKHSKSPVTGGPKKKDKRIWFYSPLLLNDLDLQRDMRRSPLKKFGDFKKLDCSCKYCKQGGKDLRGGNENRRSHFLLNFHSQLQNIISAPNRIQALKKMMGEAKKIYKKIDDENIKLDSENNGDFLDVWESVFV